MSAVPRFAAVDLVGVENTRPTHSRQRTAEPPPGAAAPPPAQQEELTEAIAALSDELSGARRC